MILDVDQKVRSYDDEGQRTIVDFLSSVVTSMSDRIAVLEPKVPSPPQNPSSLES